MQQMLWMPVNLTCESRDTDAARFCFASLTLGVGSCSAGAALWSCANAAA